MDVDDTMTSSTSSSAGAAPTDQDYVDDNLFPEGNNSNIVRPVTPQNDHLNATAPGELSPPRSQRQSITAANGNTANSPIIDNPPIGDDQKNDQPGSGWKNKKAQEEMHRAWDNIVDRDFSLKEFGDVVMLGRQQRGQT